MIDHIVGRPNPSWKRTQVFLVIIFWLWRIVGGKSGPPRILWLPKLNKVLRRFTPWQIIMSTLTTVYAVRNLDKILGLDAPEPLARLYSPSYYRATWIVTGLDAGFATAMSIRPKWLRDICSVIFSAYYVIFANEADEKLRRFRAVPTIEMLRTTWEKTTNPYLRALTYLPRVTIRRKIHLPRPKGSAYDRPLTAYLFFARPENQLSEATELVLDLPGGGFVAMNPENHEERLRMWAIKTGRPILSVDYGKAPEYPYPFASDEAFDIFRLLVETNGSLIGMCGKKLDIIVSGDSAGATLAVITVLKILEYNTTNKDRTLPLPLGVILSYAALDFNFTSWMTPNNLRILRSEQSSGNIPGIKDLAAQKDHLQHVSPLSMVKDKKHSTGRRRPKRQSSWKDTLREFTGSAGDRDTASVKSSHTHNCVPSKHKGTNRIGSTPEFFQSGEDQGILADAESEDEEDYNNLKEEDRPIEARVLYPCQRSDSRPDSLFRSESALEKHQEELSFAVAEANSKAVQAVGRKGKAKEPIGTRLTMTSRTGYFQDRVVSPTMMRAMAILYIGPYRNPDFETDYHLSPILAPPHLLAQFPPLLMQCGEKDPFVDDTVIFAGRVREAKRARKMELDLALSGKSARFGESLRMSSVDSTLDAKEFSEMKRERDKLANENETDWVQMVLFSEWSHGYLQMPTIMPEAKGVIDDLAEWINESFIKYRNAGRFDREIGKAEGSSVKTKSPPRVTMTPASPSPLTSETETDETGITFVPKRSIDRVNRASFSQNGHQGRPAGVVGAGENGSGLGESSGSDTTLINGRGEERSGTPRVTGQTITETEMMRRRRLLDAHIFE